MLKVALSAKMKEFRVEAGSKGQKKRDYTEVTLFYSVYRFFFVPIAFFKVV